MSISGTWQRLALGAVLMLALPMAQALQVTISAQYRGGASGHFENTTPPALFCQRWPKRCPEFGVVDLPITFVKEVFGGTQDTRDEYFVQLPSRREVDIYHEQTGEPHRVQLEISGVSQAVGGPESSLNPVYISPRGGCTIEATIAQGNGTVRYLWNVITPVSPAPCHSIVKRGDASYHQVVNTDEMGIVYRLSMPPPYRMAPGMYRGSVTYTIGPGGDFDFGNNVSQLNGSTLTLDFVLDVQHLFLFSFPPGSDRAVLEPAGGWLAWLGGGRAPQRIYRDMPFRLWSTGPFKAYKKCQYEVDIRCGIRNGNGDEVPVQVALSLPGGIQYQGQAAERVPLPTGRAQALAFESAGPTLNRPGQLHFVVPKDQVPLMLAHPGSTYTGQVTVVFDAEL